MELHDNHIWIYSCILQVSQSLNRDNHGIFISLILFENMAALWATCNFSVCESLPSLSRVPQGYLKLVSLLLSPRPKRIVRRKEKQDKEQNYKLPHPQRVVWAPVLSWMPGQRNTGEKLQLVIFFCWNPPMLSCLQVNLSWGICHGSSCFCISIIKYQQAVPLSSVSACVAVQAPWHAL